MKLENLSVRPLGMEAGGYEVVLHEDDARELGLYAGDRAKITSRGESVIAIVDTTKKLVRRGEIGTFAELTEELKLKPHSTVSVTSAPYPISIESIRKKMRGEDLTAEEIRAIVKDIVDGNLTPSEMAAFVTTQYIRGMSMREIADLVRSMVETGEVLEVDMGPIFDVHSIGGVPGNKYALITVPIVAAAGLVVPKTSSRAITSPAGTADVMEVLADVALSLDEIRENLIRVGAVLAWGGAVNLAPADDIIIRVERHLGLDPRCQLLASVMSKKLAVGADKILIDIPTGPGAKVESVEEARDLAHDFMNIGHELNVQVEAAVTYGGQPVGYAIGPALEAREALETLQGGGPTSLIEKATSLAGIMLESGALVARGYGREMALDILKSGKAHQKMREIIEAQGGDPNIRPEDLPVGDKKEILCAPADGYVKRIDNQRINLIGRLAGAPRDKGAGVKIILKEGRRAKKGDPLLEIYAEHEKKLDEALNFARRNPPVKIESMLIEEITHEPRIA